jgi:hypothetical protein
MTRIFLFALNVMMFGLSAVLMVKGPTADVRERQQPEATGNVGTVPNLV